MTQAKRPVFRLYFDDELLLHTDWQPVAVASWERYVRDRDFSMRAGGLLELEKDGVLLASVKPRSNGPAPKWPESGGDAPDLRSLAHALLTLVYKMGIEKEDLLDSLASKDLPTTSARLKAIRATNFGNTTAQTSPAELLVICYAAIDALSKP